MAYFVSGIFLIISLVFFFIGQAKVYLYLKDDDYYTINFGSEKKVDEFIESIKKMKIDSE